MEHPAILDRNAYVPASLFQFLNGLAVLLAPFGAVHEQHVSALRLGDGHTLKMLCDVIAGVIHIAGNSLTQLIDPLVTFGLVGTDQGVHGQDVHIVIVGLAALGDHAVTDGGVIDDMVAAHQTGQVEGLGGRIDSDSAHPCILADRLGGNVLVAFQNDVRPDFVRDHDTIVCLVDFHGLLDLPAFPDTAAGIVRAAEHGNVDVVCLDLGIHVLVVHPPDAVFVLDQRAVDDLITVVLNAHGEADVGGAVQQHGITGGGIAGQCRDNTAQNAVFVADALFGQTLDIVAGLMPLDDGVKVCISGLEVTVGGMLCTFDDGLGDGGHSGEVHVCHPHGNGIIAFLGQIGGEAGHRAQTIDGGCILAMAVHDGSEIVLHSLKHPFCSGRIRMHLSSR